MPLVSSKTNKTKLTNNATLIDKTPATNPGHGILGSSYSHIKAKKDYFLVGRNVIMELWERLDNKLLTYSP